MSFTIETIYRVRIDYEYVEGAEVNYSVKTPLEKIADKAVQLSEGVLVDNNSGGPCWNSYLVLEFFDKKEIERADKQLIAYIKKFKQVKLLS